MARDRKRGNKKEKERKQQKKRKKKKKIAVRSSLNETISLT